MLVCFQEITSETPVVEEKETELAKDALDALAPAEVNVPFSTLKDDSPSAEVPPEEKIESRSVLHKARNFDSAFEESSSSPAKILRSATNEDKVRL